MIIFDKEGHMLEAGENAHEVLSILAEKAIETHVINSGGQVNLDSAAARKKLADSVASTLLTGLTRMGRAKDLAKKYDKFAPK
jgi:hypothetical protein